MSILKNALKVVTVLAMLYLTVNAPEILRGGHDLGQLPQGLWRMAVGSAVGLAFFIGASVEEGHRQP